MLDPGKRRQRAAVSAAIEAVRCPHGRPVVLHWHPHPTDRWFHVDAHCQPGREDATRRADEALARFPSPGAS